MIHRSRPGGIQRKERPGWPGGTLPGGVTETRKHQRMRITT